MSKLEQEAFRQKILNLPPGYVKKVPYDIRQDVIFEYNGIVIKMSALYLNEALNCYMFDLSWGVGKAIYGIPIRGGINLLGQYHTPLPNMYAANMYFATTDVTSWRQLMLFVIDETVLNG